MFQITPNMSELIGYIIGDGNIHDKKPFYVEITGHPKYDFAYFKLHLSEIIQTELHYTPRIFLHSNGIRLRINKKIFVEWLKNIGMPAGKGKFERVTIPEVVLRDSLDCIKSCLRGIFDSDGCFHFDKRKVYKNPYIRIELHMLNIVLLHQIKNQLKLSGVLATISEKKKALYINGYQEVKRFLIEIGSSNSRHLNRIKRFYPELPNFNCASVAQLVERLIIK